MESQQQKQDESLFTQDPDTNFSSGPLVAAADDTDEISDDDEEITADEDLDDEL